MFILVISLGLIKLNIAMITAIDRERILLSKNFMEVKIINNTDWRYIL